MKFFGSKTDFNKLDENELDKFFLNIHNFTKADFKFLSKFKQDLSKHSLFKQWGSSSQFISYDFKINERIIYIVCDKFYIEDDGIFYDHFENQLIPINNVSFPSFFYKIKFSQRDDNYKIIGEFIFRAENDDPDSSLFSENLKKLISEEIKTLVQKTFDQ